MGETIGLGLFVLIFIIGPGVIFGWKASIWAFFIWIGLGFLVGLSAENGGNSNSSDHSGEDINKFTSTVQRDFTGKIIPDFVNMRSSIIIGATTGVTG